MPTTAPPPDLATDLAPSGIAFAADDPALPGLLADQARALPVLIAVRAPGSDTPADARRLALQVAGRALVVDCPRVDGVATTTGRTPEPGVAAGGARLLHSGATGERNRRWVAPWPVAVDPADWLAQADDTLPGADAPPFAPTTSLALRASAAPPRQPFTASFTYPFDLGYRDLLAEWHTEADEKLIQALKPRQRWHPLFDAGAKVAPRDEDDAREDEHAGEQIAELLGARTRSRPKPRPRLANPSERVATQRPTSPPAANDMAASAEPAPAATPPLAAASAPPMLRPVGTAQVAPPPVAPKPASPTQVLAKIADQRRVSAAPPPIPAPANVAAKPAPKRAAAPAPNGSDGKRAAGSGSAAAKPAATLAAHPVTHAAAVDPADGGGWAGRLAHGLREYAAALDLLAGLEDEVREARARLDEADLRIGLLEEDNARLRKDFHDFRLWVMLHAGLATLVAKDAPPPSSLVDAVMRVEQEHDGEYIAFHPRAFASAEEAPYGGSLEEAYRALSDIATIARSYHEGVIGKDPKSAFAEKGWEYRTDISDGAAGHNRSAYYLPWPPGAGEMRRLGPHIGVGGRGNAADTLRIYWFRDSAKRRYVIGHIGRHLPDSTT